MEAQKIMDTDKKNKYLISVSEDYFSHVYPNWRMITEKERMDIRNSFINDIESFLMGNKFLLICEMRYLENHLNLATAVTIVPIIENQSSKECKND